MTNFRYHKITKTRKIRYISKIYKNSSFIVFLHGFMSDLEGEKPKSFLNFAKKNKLSFLALEYSGHGKSSGVFTKGNITKWSNETSILIKKIIKKKNFIIIGSSMGAWIALNQFKKYNKQIEGFIGIGAAPEFLERLMWKKFNNKIKKELIKNKLCIIKRDNYEYPISLQLIKDGKKNSFFSKKFRTKIPVTMIHGDRDEAVPINFSKKTLKIFINAKKKLRVIKKGDHSLSSKKNIKILLNELNIIIKNV